MNFYIVSETEKLHNYQLSRHNRICIFKLVSFFFSNLLPMAGWYMRKWHWLEIGLRRCVWGSLLNRYPQSLSCNHHESYMEELSTSWGLKKTTRSRRNSAGNAHSCMLEKIDMKWGQWCFCKFLHENFSNELYNVMQL